MTPAGSPEVKYILNISLRLLTYCPGSVIILLALKGGEC